VVGFALYAWLLGAVAWTLVLVTGHRRTLGLSLSAIFLVLVVHSLLYAGFFEDPLTWGVLGLVSASLAAVGLGQGTSAPEPSPSSPERLAH
jgi:hypothetical protein